MDGLALLCNLYADGSVSLRRLRSSGVRSLEEVQRMPVASLASILLAPRELAGRLAREAAQLDARLRDVPLEPERTPAFSYSPVVERAAPPGPPVPLRDETLDEVESAELETEAVPEEPDLSFVRALLRDAEYVPAPLDPIAGPADVGSGLAEASSLLRDSRSSEDVLRAPGTEPIPSILDGADEDTLVCGPTRFEHEPLAEHLRRLAAAPATHAEPEESAPLSALALTGAISDAALVDPIDGPDAPSTSEPLGTERMLTAIDLPLPAASAGDADEGERFAVSLGELVPELRALRIAEHDRSDAAPRVSSEPPDARDARDEVGAASAARGEEDARTHRMDHASEPVADGGVVRVAAAAPAAREGTVMRRGELPGLDGKRLEQLVREGVRTYEGLVALTGLALARRTGIRFTELLDLKHAAARLLRERRDEGEEAETAERIVTIVPAPRADDASSAPAPRTSYRAERVFEGVSFDTRVLGGVPREDPGVAGPFV